MIELSDFILETLRQISTAIAAGKEDPEIKKTGAIVAPKLRWRGMNQKSDNLNMIGWTDPFNEENTQPIVAIAFDVAVTASQESGAQGKAGIHVGTFGVGGGLSKTDTDSQQSRVKFSIPLALPNEG